MRCASFTLIKRQIIDNAIYFVVALVVSFVLIIATISIVLTEDRRRLSPYAIALLLAAPILFCMGSYVVGLIQTYADRTNGITAMLSVLPVSRDRILLARLVVGVIVILMVSVPLTIVGIVLWKLLGPPSWLFHDWIADAFFGIILTTFGCYCLGLYAGGITKTFTASLCALPLTIILPLLVVIKGFDGPLLIILVPFVALSLTRCWKSDIGCLMTPITIGFIVLVFLSIPLFLGRYLCDGQLVSKIDAEARISPSGLLPSEIENDPNVQEQTEILGKMVLPQPRQNCVICKLLDSCNLMATGNFQVTHYLLQNSGIMKYFLSRRRGEYSTYSTPLPGRGRTVSTIHLDVVEGQLVHRRKSTNKPAERFTWQWGDVVTNYVGPEGVSSKPNNTGRFSSPTVFFESSTLLPWHRSPPPCIVYDRDSRRFYFVDLERQITVKGPEIQDFAIQPFQVGLLPMWETFSPAEFRLTSTKSYRVRVPIDAIYGTAYLPIVSKSGRIDLLDLRTSRIIGPVGQLPKPRTLFGPGSSEPRDLLDYDVDVVSVIPAPLSLGSGKPEVGIIGILAVSVSRQGM